MYALLLIAGTSRHRVVGAFEAACAGTGTGIRPPDDDGGSARGGVRGSHGEATGEQLLLDQVSATRKYN